MRLMNALLVVGMVAACGVPVAEPGVGPGAASEVGATHEIASVYRTPAAVVDVGRAALDFGGRAIEAASIRSGAGMPRTYGTLEEMVDGRVRYEPSPTDKLVIYRADGSKTEMAVLQLSGSGRDAESFFQEDHRIQIRFVADTLVGEVSSVRSGTRRQAALRGRARVEKAWWEADLVISGSESFDSDRSGSRLFDDHDLRGTVRREDAKIDVSEHWTYELVSARAGVGAHMGTASSAVRTVRSTAELGGARYAWREVRTRKAFRDGKPTELDTFWSADGEVLRDGATVGRLKKFARAFGESGGFVGFEVETPDGRIELERHQAY